MPDGFIEGAHIVYLMTPWGQPIWKHFTAEQWQMVNNLAAIEERPIERVVEDTVQEYFEGIIKNMIRPPDEEY